MKKGTLKRVLGVFDLFAVGYGDLGSSIFYALGVTALFALGATPIALALAGFVFVCTALSYAEMTSMFHDSGGSASFSRYAFNDFISFIAGWGLLLDYIVTIAISAFAVGPYLAYFFADLNQTPVQIVFTVALIAALLFVNILGVKHSTRISIILTVFTLLVQALIIAIGCSTILDLSAIFTKMKINIPHVDSSPTWPQFVKGIAMAMVAYTGIESIAQLGAESSRPVRNVPRAIVLVMIVLVVIYLGISVVALSAVSAHELGTKFLLNPVAAIVSALPFGSEVLAPTVALLAAVVLTVAANAGLLGASRLTFNLGAHYQLPKFFYSIHSRFKTPFVALIFFAVCGASVVVLSLGRLDFMADLYNFGAMLAFLSTHISLIVLRIRKPEMERPFKIRFAIPWGKYEIPVTAILGALSTFAVWCLVVIEKPYGRYLGGGWMVVGILMYLYYRKTTNLKATGNVNVQEIDVPDYAPIEIHHVLLPVRMNMELETIQFACEAAREHKAPLTALYVIEIFPSLPLDVNLPHRITLAQGMLKKVEAIAREMDVEIRLELMRSRNVTEAILETAQREKSDLIVLGAWRSSSGSLRRELGFPTETLMKKAPCRVIVCG